MELGIVLVYLFGLLVLTVLGAPIAAVVFQALPRKGAAFALPTAMTLFTIIVFWIGQFSFGYHTLVFGIAVLFLIAVLGNHYGGSPDWRSTISMFGVFCLGFFLMIAFRMADPGITPVGGEQFLHFGLVNAIERANSLPPEDMWFAGRPLKYYYGTQLQVTSLAILTGVPLRYGFNLGIAAFYGLLVVVAYGVGEAIVHRRDRPSRLGGIFGAFFVTLAGSTTTAIRLATPYLPDSLAERIEPAAFGFVAERFNDGDLARTVTELSDPSTWGWWYTRYVVPGTIQEVPLYSFVKADLHGHSLANGYVLFAGALALAYYATPVEARTRRRVIVFGGLGAVSGLFGFMNTWSLPTAAGLAVLAIAAADSHPATLLPTPWSQRLQPTTVSHNGRIDRFVHESWRLLLAAVAGGVVLLIGVAIASPFLVFGEIPTNRGVGLFPPRSLLGPFLVIYSGLMTVFGLYVVTRSWSVRTAVSPQRLAGSGAVLVTWLLAVAVVLDFGVLAVLGPLIVAGWLLVRSDRGDFGLVLLIAGAGLLLSFELVHARLPLVDLPRWNTSLKVAVQAWTLGAAGAGAAMALLLVRSFDRVTGALSGQQQVGSIDGKPILPSVSVPLGAIVTITLITIVFVASAVFPAMLIGTEIGSNLAADNYESSLDAHQAARESHANEYPALRWLKNQPGQPTLVEAPGDQYDWTSPAATFSGLPGVVGWDHEAEYRGPDVYQRRVSHVDAIYTGEWFQAARYLDRYDVTYVYVGPNERQRYEDELRSFERAAFTVAFESDEVTIYRVEPAGPQG